MRARGLVIGLLLVVLIAPAVLLTATRVLTPSSGFWVRLVAFTPFAIVPYALALLLLFAVLLVSRGARRGGAGVLAAVTVPLLLMHVAWAGSAYHRDVTSARGETFTVMTSNLRLGGADADQVVETATRNHVDVLVLVEVTAAARHRLRAAGLDRMLPYTAGAPAHGPTGTMVFSDARLSGVTALRTGFGGYDVAVHLPERKIHLLAVHTRPPLRNADAWATDQVTVHRAATQAERSGPVVLAGDFNATSDHAPMRELAGRGFRDAAGESGAGWQPTWPSGDRVTVFGVAVPSLLQIDHVLVDDRVRALRTESVTIRGTDHRAVVARLALRR
jgi:endonuclease/exonuclease/phosphatase (EEP) superfamily protein YafD